MDLSIMKMQVNDMMSEETDTCMKMGFMCCVFLTRIYYRI